MFNVGLDHATLRRHARQAGHILNQCGVGAYMFALLGVVDEASTRRTCTR